MSSEHRITALMEHLERVSARPGMYLPVERYDCFVAYVMGCDHALDGALLTGFEAWLVARVNGYANYAWSAIILGDVYGHPQRPLETVEDNKAAIRAAFERIALFVPR